jgi:hypothetical protein
MKKETVLRVVATGLGALLLTGTASLAFADDDYGEEGVEVLLTVPDLPSGGLSISVAGTSTNLAEDLSNTDTAIRVFTGTLPWVTVSDTRSQSAIPAGAQWYVLGQATDFVDTATTPVNPNIPVGRFGWTPELAASVNVSEVSEGDPIQTTYDSGPNNVGLAATELFALASDSAAINPTGSWVARAALVLKADASVAPGNYKSVLTLSLFE